MEIFELFVVDQVLDPEMKEASAVPYYENLVELSKLADMIQWKSTITAALYYLAVYSDQIKNDRTTVIDTSHICWRSIQKIKRL
ncbi:MAG: hypothetical protein ACMUEM_02725 [Flavobacteriales bacterium AspAUS03]